MCVKDVVINNQVGLHARPAGMLVKLAKEFQSEIEIVKDGNSVNATKLMALMGLGVKCGDTITVSVDGGNEDEAEKAMKEFLESNHTYGHAACRYCYGMFLKRHTGHVAASVSNQDPSPGTLVAVATFSNARKWAKGDKIIRSYEWTRYASLPGVRLSGGMGRMLKTFIKEVQPDDIMSYADLEWSAGDVYKQLGFELEGQKAPVLFTIDPDTWQRTPVKATAYDEGVMSAETYFQNLGSNKYRLKLTDYK